MTSEQNPERDAQPPDTLRGPDPGPEDELAGQDEKGPDTLGGPDPGSEDEMRPEP